MSSTVSDILAKAVQGARIQPSEAAALFRFNDLAALGMAADRVCQRLHPESYRTYVVDRNINYTNICVSRCKFCAFNRQKGDADAYVLALDGLFRKIEETLALGGTQILMQGGLHPDLKLD
ncbi:MAG: dehypoxanthine futalosine cyclase, partial [Planctomycetes bacterium]|nr:dehypoxanthine futalosine cyclase [Planctomycetota bacterium]